MNVISNILYWISTGLLVPVIVLLIFFFLRSLILIGGFFGQYLQEKKLSRELYGRISGLTPENLPAFEAEFKPAPGSLFESYAGKILADGCDGSRAELALSEYELAADKNIATSRILTKMGPILGLMGTLIPMGPAVVGLSTGDISSMAYNMQVAFATTVVGLFAAAVGFITQQVKQRWYLQDMTNLEFLSNLFNEKPEVL